MLEKRGDHDKATELYQSALRVRLALFGRKHVAVADSMNAFGVMTHHHLKVRLVIVLRRIECEVSSVCT